MSYFEKINQERARRVTNVLVEAPFFYRDDDEDLFLFLRRNRAAFQRFFDECFGWELVVESRCARVLKSSWQNPALRPSQHDVFNLTRRDDCVSFLLVLEFYEHLLEEQNLSIDDPDPPRFYFGSLFEFARERYAEELGEATPEDAAVRKSLRRVVDILLRYRFLRELAPEPDDRVEAGNLIYECLPGLYCYDFRRLGPQALARFLGAEATEEATAS